MPPSASIADRLAAHLRAGTLLDLVPDRHGFELIDEAEMQAWGDERDVDADVLRDLLLGRVVTDPDPRGIRLRGARVRGRLDLSQVRTTVTLELADCLLEQGTDAEGAHLAGLWLHRCRLSHAHLPAFAGDRLRIDNLFSLTSSVLAVDDADGAVTLQGARIGGRLDFSCAALRNPSGPALAADWLQTDGDLSLDDGFTAHGAGPRATIQLVGARIGGRLDCSGATVHNPTGPALRAVHLQTDGPVLLTDGFTADGAVWLSDSRVRGPLECRGAVLRNPTGPALILDRGEVTGNVFLNQGFTAEGIGPGGAVRLLSTRIGGQLTCRGATMRNTSGPALVADRVEVGANVLLDQRFSADGTGERATVRLPGAHIGGRLDCRDSTVTSASDERHRWQLDGLVYAGTPRLDPGGHDREAWLSLLRDGTPAYAAQPYQQLAAGYRADGHDGDVRAILMAQRRDQLRRGALTRRVDRWWARSTGLLLGYGYQPWRALLYLTGVLTVSVVLAFVLGGQGALARSTDVSTPPAPTVPMPCTAVQTIATGLDLGAPFLPTSRTGGGGCEITADARGEALTVSRWFLQLAAWALAALFVAGFTGIVRRT